MTEEVQLPLPPDPEGVMSEEQRSIFLNQALDPAFHRLPKDTHYWSRFYANQVRQREKWQAVHVARFGQPANNIASAILRANWLSDAWGGLMNCLKAERPRVPCRCDKCKTTHEKAIPWDLHDSPNCSGRWREIT